MPTCGRRAGTQQCLNACRMQIRSSCCVAAAVGTRGGRTDKVADCSVDCVNHRRFSANLKELRTRRVDAASDEWRGHSGPPVLSASVTQPCRHLAEHTVGRLDAL